MKRVIILDVHENIGPVKRILDREAPDAASFLGDWTDRFPSQPGNLNATLDWLTGNFDNPNFDFHLGNHDAPYVYENIPQLMCSGHQYTRHVDIAETLRRLPFKLYSEVEGGWLLSHAGLHAEYACRDWRLFARQAMECLGRGQMHFMVRIGEARGGAYRDVGGFTWLDWDEEFQPVEGLKQIVGHTKSNLPRRKGDNWCIDTAMGHYGVLLDGELFIRQAGNGEDLFG